MSTDLDAAVARLEERCRHGELRRVGVVSADVRLLLADWKRLREMTSPAAGLARLEQELGIMDKTIAERDAARAELARLRERDARVREAFRLIDWMAKEYAEAGGSGGPEMRAYNEAIALLKETP